MIDKDSQTLRTSAIPVCGIGASAGGLEALQKFFSAVPDDLGVAYVVIVHLAPDRKSDLPAIISRWTNMPVMQVGDHDRARLAANHVYVIAPDSKLEISDTWIGASSFERTRGRRAAIDLFFRSLAESRGDGFAIVLSGSGSDGALGARAVKEGGGLVLVQDPSEALYGDMPRAVIDTGVADIILPVNGLVARLTELARGKERIVSVVRAAEQADPINEDEEKALRGIFDLLRKRTGHDFSKYKRNTVLRRLARRMQLCHQVTIADYLQYLAAHVPEVRGLFDDLLISVTTFFRDSEAWEALQTQVIAPLVERVEPNEQIRAWVPGCATGEEAYTLAILFHEEFERRKIERSFIIFASDPDESSIGIARGGLYPRAISADVSESRLERYFRPEGDHYRVVSGIRDYVVFAAHNLLRDPPFSRLHLISCRNLLIYLDRDLQEQAMGVFRYACRDQAYLFLGAAETADEALFRPLDKKHRIFTTRESKAGRPPLPEVLTTAGVAAVRQQREVRSTSRLSAAEVHITTLEDIAPPSVIVDERGYVLHLSPSAARFFLQGEGPLANRVTDLVRPELRDELHALLHRAFEQPMPQLSPFVPVAFNGTPHRVAILAQQRIRRDGGERNALLTFLDGGDAAGDTLATEQEPTNELVRSLREKLRQEEQRFESMRNDYNLTNEDLRAANEELQSLNEEYRSTTEELETSKEELQSINEELQTVNLELKLKLEEVSRTNSDLENLMAANDVATLFLDLDCRISRFTPRLSEIFSVKPRDRERPIADLTHSLEYDAFEQDARNVLLNSAPIEHEVASRDGRRFMVRMSPYRKVGDGEVGGVVVTFIDVTAIKRAETALRESERKLLAQDQNKEAFLAALGHELRNPMAAMLSSLEVISVVDEPSRRATVILKRQMHHMARLVNDLLDVSRINRGTLRVEREAVDLNQSVQAAVEAVRREADIKGLALEFDSPASPVYVEADPERLAQILDNLLDNALKYTEHGRITISVRQDTTKALISIRDTGMGMNPDQAKSLFDTPHRIGEDASIGGLGLGLQLVKRLVNSHHGTIEFHSEGRGLGSEVTFTLPLLRSASHHVSSAASARKSVSRRILVVDDQPDAADALGLLLESIGQEVRVAYGGDDAIKIALEQRPQVAFIDLSMPGTSGAEVGRRLRQEFSPSQLTLVALSGYSKDHPAAQSMQFEHHLLKPTTMENIITLLNSLPVD